ncbi:hypothetical protein ISN45_At02g006950 [Arabidopsis thaliana x Arabidopsis arenosa]|uniref:Uncharacterized protein n=1 Tax=Arabidopsis thaliana x Arabidopsis arenosa TaxID=1240361 RepID=A0A8T2FID8_9BRAS|nr:hypothetical protein ISN45_At02g006950 [Arabidopsis thaliana x Arabidopsis arenosa]
MEEEKSDKNEEEKSEKNEEEESEEEEKEEGNDDVGESSSDDSSRTLDRESSSDESMEDEIAVENAAKNAMLKSLKFLVFVMPPKKISPEISPQIKLISPELTDAPESPPAGHTCAFEIFFSECGLYFPLLYILIEFMHEFRVALPQLYPNVIRTILSLLTLAEEDEFLLSLSDLLQLYAVKKGRTSGTFFLSPRKARVEKTPISKTFAAHFSSFCRQDLGWKVLTNDRIQASGRRLCSRIDLASSSPQFKPRIFSEAEMAASSYRAEKKMESERARKQKERLQSDKVLPLHPEKVQRSPLRRQELRARMLPMLPTKDPARWDVHKQRKHSETEARSPTRSSRAQTEVKDDGTNQQKGSNKKGDSQDLVVLSSRGSESRNSQRRDTLPLPAPPMHFADMLRTLVHLGATIPPLTELMATNKENYLLFAEKLNEAVQEFNYAFISHEDQLSEKDKEIESFKHNEDENARMVDEANSVLSRMRAAEARVQTLEISNTDLSAKLKLGKNAYLTAIDNENRSRAELLACEERLKKLEEGQAVMLHAARQDERRKIRAQFVDLSSKYGNFYTESNEVKAAKIRAAEVKANRELLEEIEKGEIPSIAEELESVRADEQRLHVLTSLSSLRSWWIPHRKWL